MLPRKQTNTIADLVQPLTLPWEWRYEVALFAANHIDFSDMGIKGIYLIGSVKNASAGILSDIDLIIHYIPKDKNRIRIEKQFSEWDRAITETFFDRTGFRVEEMFDLHWITDEDIMNGNSYTVMLKSMDNSALPLKIQ
jgi:hypothetical protein